MMVWAPWLTSRSRPIVGNATLDIPRLMLATTAPRHSAVSTHPARGGRSLELIPANDVSLNPVMSCCNG